MPQYSTLARLTQTAEDQWGLVTRQQAVNSGVSRRTMERLTADGSVLKKVGRGVYRLTGAPQPDHEDLRAAWLQLAPAVPGWARNAAEGAVSHRSAAKMYGVGHLPEEQHEFTVASRHQTRRHDVRLHHRKLADQEWIILRGLPVTRPARIAGDLLRDKEDPTAVAHIVGDSLRNVYEYPGTVADALNPFAGSFGLRRGDGLALLRWLLDLVGDPQTELWMSEARTHGERVADTEHAPSVVDGYPLK
jgi:hypothetical protein